MRIYGFYPIILPTETDANEKIVGWANGFDANLWVLSNNFAHQNRRERENYLTMVAIAIGGKIFLCGNNA